MEQLQNSPLTRFGTLPDPRESSQRTVDGALSSFRFNPPSGKVEPDNLSVPKSRSSMHRLVAVPVVRGHVFADICQQPRGCCHPVELGRQDERGAATLGLGINVDQGAAQEDTHGPWGVTGRGRHTLAKTDRA